MPEIKGSNGVQHGTMPVMLPEVASGIKSVAHVAKDLATQAPRPPHAATKTSQAKILEQQKLQEFTAAYTAGNEYEKLHARIAARFPEIGPADGTPIGIKLSSLSGPILTKEDMRPGDILLCYEPDPDPSKVVATRQLTIKLQQADHNGIPDALNQGDFKNVHNAIWTQTPGNVKQTSPWGFGEPEVVEGRAARPSPEQLAKNPNAKAINRVQPALARQAGLANCKVFRCTDPNVADWMAQFAMVMANGHVIYGSKALSEGGKGHFSPTPESKKLVAQIAEDADNPVPRWAVNPINMQDIKKEGINCTSLMIRVAQAAQLRVNQAKEVEKGNPPPSLEQLTEQLTGLHATNSSHVSVRAIEHFLLHGTDAEGKPQFEFVGKFHAPKEQAYPEIIPPMEPAHSGALPETHPDSIEYAARSKEWKNAELAAKADEQQRAQAETIDEGSAQSTSVIANQQNAFDKFEDEWKKAGLKAKL